MAGVPHDAMDDETKHVSETDETSGARDRGWKVTGVFAIAGPKMPFLQSAGLLPVIPVYAMAS